MIAGMVDDIAQMLWRNAGSVLTPELIAGLIQGAEYLSQPVTLGTVPAGPIPTLPAPGPRLVIDRQDEVANWVAEQIGQTVPFSGFGAIGLENAHGELVGGFVLENVTQTNGTVHVAGLGKRWVSRGFLRACFSYAFNDCGLERVTGYVAADNEAALRFDRQLGFQDETVIRQGCGAGDVIVLVMWKDNCRWL